jgi:hypothetical protein
MRSGIIIMMDWLANVACIHIDIVGGTEEIHGKE